MNIRSCLYLLGLPIALFGSYLIIIFPVRYETKNQAVRQQSEIYRQQVLKEEIIKSDKALIVNPQDRKALVDRADAKLELKNVQDAIADYTSAIGLNPQDLNIYIRRGKARQQAHNYSGALTDFRQALKLQPDNEDMYRDIMGIFGFQGQHQNVIAEANLLIKKNPQSQIAYAYRGEAYRELGDLEKANADEQIVQDRAKKAEEEAIPDRSQTYWQQQIEAANTAFRCNSRDRQSYYDRANSYANLQKYPAAIADFNKAIELDPTDLDVQIRRGYIFLKLKSYNRALADADFVLNLEPKNMEAIELRRQVLHYQLLADIKENA
jgi:tetratricopeptide (TPR) repeat protein